MITPLAMGLTILVFAVLGIMLYITWHNNRRNK